MKLVTAGCSFTDMQPWPSYGDWLGYYFNDYQDISKGGSGNRSIYHTTIQAVQDGTINENTFVVVQWSSCLREDRYLPNTVDGLKATGYARGGSVYNNCYYDLNFVTKYFNPLQNVVEHQNYIFSLKTIFKSLNIKYLMTFMQDPRLEDMLGEPGYGGGKRHSEYFRLFEECKPVLKNYDQLIDDSFTSTGIMEHMLLDTYQATTYSHKDCDSCEPQKEGHPSPMQAFRFMLNVIAPKLNNMHLNTPSQLLDLVNEWEEFAKIKKASEDKIEPIYWPTRRFRSGEEIYISKNFKKEKELI